MATDSFLAGAIRTFDWTDLPKRWEFDLLGNRCKIRRGSSPRPAGDPRYFGNGTIPWIKIGDATRTGSRYIDSTEECVNEDGAKCSVRIPAGSLIIANSGVSLGFAAITRIAGCIHDGWLLASGFRQLDRDFLYYCVNLFTHRVRRLADGTTQPNLNTDIARRLLLPMPPLKEQKAIAHILGTLDDKIELNRRMNETLEGLARAVFKSWFVDFDPVRAKAAARRPAPSGRAARPDGVCGLPPEIANLFPDSFQDSELGKIPKGWRVGTVNDVAAINARTLGRDDFLETIDYIEISEVMRGEVNAITRYTRGQEPSRARRRLQNGNTVISTVRPDRGAYFLTLEPSESLIASTGFAVLTPKTGHWAFLHTLTTQEEMGDELGGLQTVERIRQCGQRSSAIYRWFFQTTRT